MLKEFLKLNLIAIDEDENLAKLEEASKEITQNLKKDKSKIISYTLISLDPDIPASNSDINDVSDIIMKYWKTFSSKSKDTPLTIIRAVILEALQSVSAENSNTASCIWLTGRNIINHLKLKRERELLRDFILDLGNKTEEEAELRWALPADAKPKKLAVQFKDIKSEPPEQHTTIIATGLTELQEKTNQVLIETQKEIYDKIKIFQMRTQLIWWREACYSSTLKQSYREMKNGLVQIALAKDYSIFIPLIFPRTIDNFLIETNRLIVNDDNKKIKFSELFKTLSEENDKLKVIFNDQHVYGERITLLNFINGMVWGKYNFKQFKSLLGIAETTEIPLCEFSLWLFHDLQSLKILNIK